MPTVNGLPPVLFRMTQYALIDRQQRSAVNPTLGLAASIAGVGMRRACARRVSPEACLKLPSALLFAAAPAGVRLPHGLRLRTARYGLENVARRRSFVARPRTHIRGAAGQQPR